MKSFPLSLFFAFSIAAQENWPDALRKMEFSAGTPPLNRDNAMSVMLRAFQSNTVVKGMIFLPAVADDFFLINRGKPDLNLRPRHLLEAVAALTNATAVRATFRPPLLLLHLERDRLEPVFTIKNPAVAARLQQQRQLPHALFVDTHWERVQPALEKNLGLAFLPAAQSEDAWHFNRHYLAAWGLSDWELLTALSLAGKTSFTVQKSRVVFAEGGKR